MSATDTFRKSSAIALIAASTAFGTAAQAGNLYDQCLGFVVDVSSSTEPHGYLGQMRGIAAGLRDSYVADKVSHMDTGMKIFMIVFSSDVRRVMMADVHSPASLQKVANDIDAMKKPFGGNNNLFGAMALAHKTFQEIEAGGEGCLVKTIDFSGDGAEVFTAHQKIRDEVLAMAGEGITVNGLSFFDVRWSKFTTSFDGFKNIHDYYEKIIVTPAGHGARPGMHFTIMNTPAGHTADSIVEQITEQMRTKVRNEVASRDDVVRARFAHQLRAPLTPGIATYALAGFNPR